MTNALRNTNLFSAKFLALRPAERQRKLRPIPPLRFVGHQRFVGGIIVLK